MVLDLFVKMGLRNSVLKTSPNNNNNNAQVNNQNNNNSRNSLTPESTTSQDARMVDADGVMQALGITNIKDVAVHSPHEIVKGELELGKKLYDGSFSTIYEAKYRGTTIIVKCLHEDIVKNDKQDFKAIMKEFSQEILIHCQLRHRNIVRLAGIYKPSYGLVMELAPLGNMSDYINTHEQLPLLMCQKIMKDIARAMEYLHQVGVLHRNLNLSDVLLFSIDPTDPCHAKICDFGNALYKERKWSSNCGTIIYPAPEMLDEKNHTGENCTQKTDVFAFGFVLWGIMEWKTQDYLATADSIRKNTRPQLPEEGMSLFPDDTVALVARCWHHDPDHRPSFREIVSNHFKTDVHNNADTQKQDTIDPKSLSFNKDEDGMSEVLSESTRGILYKGVLTQNDGQKVDVVIKQMEDIQEIRIAGKLRHDHIIKYFGWYYKMNKSFLVMEHCPLGDLSKLIAKKEPQVQWENRGKHIALQVACAIHYLHSWGIVHRDIKSANVLIRENFDAVLIDFELSNYLSVTRRSSANNSGAGTVTHNPPEAFGKGSITFASDVYSFAVIIWELYHHKQPWVGKNAAEIQAVVANPKQPQHLNVDEVKPPRLQKLLQNCLRYSASHRPDMEEVVAELEAIVKPSISLNESFYIIE